MSDYAPLARDINKICGASFTIRNLGTEHQVPFSIPQKDAARIRVGLEAYGILVECDHPTRGRLKSFQTARN